MSNKLFYFLSLIFFLPIEVVSNQTIGLKEVDCWFETTSSVPTSCFHQYLNENPSDKYSKIIRTSVVIFKSTSKEKKKDPVLYLNGGPSQALITNNYIGWTYRNNVLKYWLKDRDVIIAEYRGLGLSEPLLKCNDLDHGSLLAKNHDDWYIAYKKCHAELESLGVDLSQYHALNVVSDLVRLRNELNINRWNLWGHSYGSMIAMLLADQDNEFTRSVIAEGVMPPRYRADKLSHTDEYLRVLDELFRICKDVFYCNNAHPNPMAELVDLLEKLEKNPVEIEIKLFDKNYKVHVDDTWFLDVIFHSLYWKRSKSHVPYIVGKVKSGDYRVFVEEFTNIYQSTSLPLFSYGGFMTYSCNETNVLSQKGLRDLKLPAWFKKSFLLPDFCEIWNKKSDLSVLNEVSISFDTPILFLSGLLDPTTPAIWTEKVLDDFKNGQRFVFPNASHNLTETDTAFCMSILKSEFIDTPLKKINQKRCDRENIKYPEDLNIGVYPEKY